MPTPRGTAGQSWEEALACPHPSPQGLPGDSGDREEGRGTEVLD